MDRRAWWATVCGGYKDMTEQLTLPHFSVRNIKGKKTAFVVVSYFNFIGVQLIYSVVLVSGVWQSDSVIHIPSSDSFLIEVITEY